MRACALEYRSSEKRYSEIAARILGNKDIGYEYQEWYREQSYRYVVAGYEIFRQIVYQGDIKACAQMSVTLLSSAEQVAAIARYLSDSRIPPFDLTLDEAEELSLRRQ